ncbi:MAG: hypothetical protein IKS15_01500 [Opitutales bacterium]|nr:hypothetical protein [Opitutales bacterium]
MKKLWSGLLVGAKLRAVSCFAARRFDSGLFHRFQCGGSFLDSPKKIIAPHKGKKEANAYQ